MVWCKKRCNVCNSYLHLFCTNLPIFLNPSSAEARAIFLEEKVNIIAADALAPDVARPSAAIILTIQKGYIFVFLNSKSQ